MTISQDYINNMADAVRVSSETAKSEIADLIQAGIADMQMRGVIVTDPEEALCKQAVKLYVKGNYGYDKDTERYRDAYEALRDSMALSGDYEGSE